MVGMAMYFAYGLDLNRKHMKERCPDSKPKFTATLPNFKLIFVGWSRQWRGGLVTIKPFRGEKVLGAIYEVSQKDISRLDTYEGHPGTSNRLDVTVFDEDGQAIPAITYLRVGQRDEAKPSPEYLAIIQQGYRDWALV